MYGKAIGIVANRGSPLEARFRGQFAFRPERVKSRSQPAEASEFEDSVATSRQQHLAVSGYRWQSTPFAVAEVETRSS
jgi:hypothetical protein